MKIHNFALFVLNFKRSETVISIIIVSIIINIIIIISSIFHSLKLIAIKCQHCSNLYYSILNTYILLFTLYIIILIKLIIM
jgi:hypothetical protein